MFFLKKNQSSAQNEENLKRIEERLERLEQLLQTRQQENEALRREFSENRKAEEAGLSRELEQFGRKISRHDMAIENLLDMLEERQEEELSNRRRTQEQREEEEQFLGLFAAYQEQFWQLRSFLDGSGAAWSRQAELMEQELAKSRRYCGIEEISQIGETVDYQIHEVIEVIDTADMAQDRTVAQVFSPGYLYQGRVRKKARVAVYRMI